MRYAMWATLLAGYAFTAVAQQPAAREISFTCDGLAVPGTLLLPAGKAVGPGWPVVVLVQGSGPSDRDETIGQNTIFKDLAEGLAARGVATLRYDKRTWLMAHGKIKIEPGDDLKITLATEVVDDAVAALGFAAGQAGVDAKRVYLLGHSLGGSLAPRIAAERLKAAPGSVRGVILLSAGALPVSVILPMQVAFQAELRGQGREASTNAVAQINAMFKDVADPATDASKRTMVGVPAGYLRDWIGLDTAKGLKDLELPALVLHGQKDVQIGYVDYVLLARAATAPQSKALEFPGLNHLFQSVVGESTGAEYVVPQTHMAPVVAETIAAWIAMRPR